MQISNQLFIILLINLMTSQARGRQSRFNATLSLHQLKKSKPMWCPYRCKCNSYRREVNCSYRKLTQIPKGIPVAARSLILTGNKIKQIPKRSFWMLRHLETLKLNGNHLDLFSNRVFQHLRKLRELDLSSNKLEKLPIRAFRKLGNLQILNLRNNKLGKLPIDVFSGLSQLTEIELSSNSLQTLELKMFEELDSLKEIYLDRNRWHCDCSLKKTEIGLRQREVRTGYIVCDSPNLLAGHHLREKLANSLCARKHDDLAYILLGITCVILAILFSIFMCRRRIPTNIAAQEAAPNEIKPSIPLKREDTLSTSSIVYDSDSDSGANLMQQLSDRSIDLLKASGELNADVLPFTSRASHDVKGDVMSPQNEVSTSTELNLSSSSSCPNIVDLSARLDKFSRKRG